MSSVQFNLLPDVKMQYVKSLRSRNMVFGIALLISGISLVIFLILLFSVNFVQKKQLNDAKGQITSATNRIKDIPNFNKVLTVQNQLTTLKSLHQGKHISSRLFGYLPQLTPTDIKLTTISVDLASKTMNISGTAPSHHSLNTFIDTLKFTTYKINDSDSAKPAFPQVVESSFSITPGNASFSITAQFDPTLFTGGTSATPKLTVPKLTTTRSVIDDPSNPLFNNSSQGQ